MAPLSSAAHAGVVAANTSANDDRACRSPGTSRQTDASEHAALLRLLAAGGATAPRRRLLERHGGPGAALRAGSGAWLAAGLTTTQCRALQVPADPAVVGWLQWPRHHLLGWHDPDYPALLRHSSNPPLALFIDGDPSLLLRPAVAVVGSRAASVAGREHAALFTAQLIAAGLSIGSGLAAGIDAAAHQAALDAGGATFAVVGCGPDVAYPARHRRLRDALAEAGTVVSEHPPGTSPRREYFPSRNRILAGLTLATLVIEAGERSGALITARLAAEAGREVLAVPGSIRNPLSRGCHRLLRDGAYLAESAADVLQALGPAIDHYMLDLRRQLDVPIAAAGPRPDCGGAVRLQHGPYKMLWQALGHDPSTMDELSERSGLTVAELSSMLLLMELEGQVAVEHGRYTRRA